MAEMAARVVNLTFHGIGAAPHALDPSEAAVWVAEERFRQTLDAIHARRDVRVSFDDGNGSDIDVALPELLDRGMTATFFVLAARLDAPGFLSRADVRRLADAGMTIGSHGMHHRDWRTLSDAELDEELRVARDRLQDVSGVAVTETSIPFGSYDRRVLARIRRDGAFTRVYTSDGGTVRADAWLQPRNSLRADDPPGTPRLDVRQRPVESVAGACKRLVKRWR